MSKQPILLAFSGGLDTSFCVVYLLEKTGYPVITATIDTVGLSAREKEDLASKSAALGAADHLTIDGREHLFDHVLSYLVKGNVLKGDVYPLCVGPERVTQSIKIAELAGQLGASAVAHGCTGAGNDQIRFDIALQLLVPDLPVIAPIRDEGLSRDETAQFLRERGFEVSQQTEDYSINAGLWGTTIGGKETHGSESTLPEEAYTITRSLDDCPSEPTDIALEFENGVPVGIDGIAQLPLEIITYLNELGGRHGVGRGMHLGDTVLGIKGRVGFEAPAALILIDAHRELEKLVLTKWQQYQKRQQADLYGMLLHEGQYFDPVMRDIEAAFDSSQTRVTGNVTVRLYKGTLHVTGVSSPFSMLDQKVARYGEENHLWDGSDAKGFARIMKTQAALALGASQISTETA